MMPHPCGQVGRRHGCSWWRSRGRSRAAGLGGQRLDALGTPRRPATPRGRVGAARVGAEDLRGGRLDALQCSGRTVGAAAPATSVVATSVRTIPSHPSASAPVVTLGASSPVFRVGTRRGRCWVKWRTRRALGRALTISTYPSSAISVRGMHYDARVRLRYGGLGHRLPAHALRIAPRQERRR